MADLSGGKRDRRSDDTDDPVTTPNTRDTKLSCWDPDDASGEAYDAETVENGKSPWNDSPKGDHDDTTMTGGLTAPKDQPVIDVDDLISSGGVEPGDPPPVLRATTPKKLFFDSDDEDDDGAVIESVDDVTKDPAKEIYNEASTTKHTITDDNNTTPEKSITKKTTEKENKKNNNNKTIHETIDSNEFILVTTKSNSNLDLSTLSEHSSKWKKLDDHSRKLSPFGDNDRPAILKVLEATLIHFNKDKTSSLSREDWAKIFGVTASASGKNKAKFVKHFGARLILSSPKDLFLPHEFNAETNILLQGKINNAWAGAYLFYGPGWLPEIIISLDTAEGLKPPTTWWTTLSAADVKKVIPFSTTDVFKDDGESMHDLERHLKVEFKIRAGSKRVDPREWLERFTAIKDTPGSARDSLIQLAMTPISIFAAHDWFHDEAHTQLLSNSVSNIWVGAYLLAGSPWMTTDEDMVEASSSPAAPTSAKPPSILISKLKPKSPAKVHAAAIDLTSPSAQGVSFGSEVKSRSLFLSRGPRKAPPAKPKPKADKRKHEDVYYSIELPPIDSSWQESGAELTAQFVSLVEHILNKDRKALIHQWDSPGGALSKKSLAVKSKQQARRFVNSSLFTRQGFETKIRIRVSHDVLPLLLELSSSDSGMTIEKDHIQEKEQSIIGFLVGSCPEAINLEDMRTSHENHSVLHGLKIICEDRAINLASHVLKIPFKLQTKAIHILVGASQAVDARDRYNRVFGSRNEGGYPQGLQMRFVPDIADARFPSTPNTRMKAVKMMSKQKAFLDNTKVIATSTIAGVHTVVSKIGYSLCQILMAIKSKDDPDMGLFISIDEKDSDGAYTTLFTVHKDRYEEASGLIPLFCIIYAAKFGVSAWEWFTDDAKVVLTKYRWDQGEGQVVPIVPEEDEELDLDSDDEYFSTMADLLNIDTSASVSKGFVFDIDYVIEEATPSKNQFGDTGSVKTFRDACVDPEDDSGTGSVAELEAPPSTPDTALRSQSPVDEVDADAVTQATSTLTDDSSDVAASLEQLMLQHPKLAQQLYLKSQSTTVAVSPSTAGVDGN